MIKNRFYFLFSFLQRTQTRYIYIVILFSAWIGFFFLSPLTRNYSIQTFWAGDSAYAVYDDFISRSDKSLWPFALIISLTIPGFILLRESHRFIAYLGLGLGMAIVWFQWSWVILIGSLWVGVFYPWKQLQLSGKQCKLFGLILLLFALALRLEKLPNVYHLPLQQDVMQYVQLSQSMHWFYDTDHREPLLAWVIKILSFFFPIPSDLTAVGYLPIRLVTIVLSACIPVLVYGIGKQWFSHQVAALSAWILVLDKALIYRSLQGLREEMLTLGVLLVLHFALMRIPDRKIKFLPPLVLGISSGLLLLVRTACLPYVGFLVFVGGWLKQYSWKECAAAFLIMLIIASPYYIYCKYQFGDFMYSGNYHLNKFYYMTVLHHDDPNLSQYPFVSSSELMLKIFPWYRSMQFFAEGFLDTFFGRYALRLLFVPFSVLGIGCSLIGYVLWLQERRKRILLISIALLLGPMAFVMGMLNHSPITFDWRTVVHLTPFLAFAASEGWFSLLYPMQSFVQSSNR